MKYLVKYLLVGSLFFTLTACWKNSEETGIALITKPAIRAHIKYLASDELEGRDTGSRGHQLAAQYVSEQFKAGGVKSGTADGTYFQKVPFIGYAAVSPVKFEFVKGRTRIPLRYKDDFVANTGRAEPNVLLNKEIVFVGYGIEAPEQKWDDYKGADVRDKVLLVIVNDPPSDDPNFFGGKAMTYYGRWTYKYEIAGQKGAAGVIVIHTDDKAGYGWQVVRNSWTGKQSMLKPGPNDPPKSAVESWITKDMAEKLFKLAGYSFSDMYEKAGKPDFKPIPLKVNLDVDLKSEITEFESDNVVGIVEGKIKDEYVVYSSHIDHLGIGTVVNGDSIYNGAQDNASGAAALIEIAKAYAKLPQKPNRTMVFLAVTAEERGLLGSKYYALNPLFPLNKTLANVNFDMLPFFGRVKDVVMLGADKSSLGSVCEQAASEDSLKVIPDPSPEQGHMFRSDQFSFMRAGVTVEGKPEGWGKEQKDKYTKEKYHQPFDEYTDDVNLDGTLQMARLAFKVGFCISKLTEFPVWNEGEPFKRIREESMKK